ncbi:FeoB-associated Cys-rich membrane protein [uncultured Maribacter sp.]|uniref:FeoB-associated Cys-rich membrane protein n=1 Tax=uncultured Maribacter sp. TaxID=431308 RepID=UPI0026175FAC|nr:FeoB-associated Cys-rich membrane protein [uncultured Maribacter sp.]
MSTIIQNILVFATLILAVGFLVKKFFLPKPVKVNKNKFTKSCSQEGGCSCS